jgi:hypothetical protein
MCNCKHKAEEFKLASEAPFNFTLVEIDGEWLEIGVQDVEYMEEHFPETFSIPEQDVREIIPVGMIVKVIVDWRMEGVPNERFWVEVSSIDVDEVGTKVYFGVLRNDTIIAPWGAMIGPIYAWNICDIDIEEYLNRHATDCPLKD